MEELIRKMATMVIEENRRYVGEDIAEEAIKEINSDEEGGNSNEEIKKKTTRGRKKKTVN